MIVSLPLRSALTDDALRVIARPEPADTPSLRASAWAHLKSKRGQTVNQLRLHQLTAQRAAGGAQ